MPARQVTLSVRPDFRQGEYHVRLYQNRSALVDSRILCARWHMAHRQRSRFAGVCCRARSLAQWPSGLTSVPADRLCSPRTMSRGSDRRLLNSAVRTTRGGMATIVTWGSCPECGNCGEAAVKIEHVIDGWTKRPMHKTNCPDCGELYAIVMYDCPDCRPNTGSSRLANVSRDE